MPSIPNAPTITTRRVQRRRQPVRSLDALWDRILQLGDPFQEEGTAIQHFAPMYRSLCQVPEAMRNHRWASDFDNLELRIRRAEGAAR